MLDGSGEILLTGDLYKMIRNMPYEYIDGQAIFSVQADISGTLNDETIHERQAEVSFYASHLHIKGSGEYHVPLEDIFYASTESNKKLALSISKGFLKLYFHQRGSVLQWYDELLRTAPSILN